MSTDLEIVHDLMMIQRGAKFGDFGAQLELARRYELGRGGVTKNGATAMIWYRAAADNGSTDALLSLGLHYQAGDLVTKDAFEAIKWLKLMVGLSEVRSQRWLDNVKIRTAQFALAEIYSEDQGAAKDLVEAFKWLKIIAATTHPQALERMNDLRLRMTPEQIAEGRERAKSYLNSKADNEHVPIHEEPPLKTESSVPSIENSTSTKPKKVWGLGGGLALCFGFILFMALFQITGGAILLVFPILLLVVFGVAMAEQMFGSNPSIPQILAGAILVIVLLLAVFGMMRGCHGASEDGPNVDGVRSVD